MRLVASPLESHHSHFVIILSFVCSVRSFGFLFKFTGALEHVPTFAIGSVFVSVTIAVVGKAVHATYHNIRSKVSAVDHETPNDDAQDEERDAPLSEMVSDDANDGIELQIMTSRTESVGVEEQPTTRDAPPRSAPPGPNSTTGFVWEVGIMSSLCAAEPNQEEPAGGSVGL